MPQHLKHIGSFHKPRLLQFLRKGQKEVVDQINAHNARSGGQNQRPEGIQAANLFKDIKQRKKCHNLRNRHRPDQCHQDKSLSRDRQSGQSISCQHTGNNPKRRTGTSNNCRIPQPPKHRRGRGIHKQLSVILHRPVSRQQCCRGN